MLLASNIHWTGQVSPVAFTIFGRDIAWYGIIITCAMLAGLIAGTIRAKKIGMSFDDLVEVFICAIPLAILGARLGYVMVRPEYFPADFTWDDFVRIFAVWDGGLTIMTGVPFGVLGAWLWSKWRKVNFVDIADVVIPVVLLSQGLGRWGNFMNQEIYGAPITNPNMQWFPMGVYIASEQMYTPEYTSSATVVVNQKSVFSENFSIRTIFDLISGKGKGKVYSLSCLSCRSFLSLRF